MPRVHVAGVAWLHIQEDIPAALLGVQRLTTDTRALVGKGRQACTLTSPRSGPVESGSSSRGAAAAARTRAVLRNRLTAAFAACMER
jgi:hypothetical protein